MTVLSFEAAQRGSPTATDDNGQYQLPPDQQTARTSAAGGAVWAETKKIRKHLVTISAMSPSTRHPR